MSEKQLPPFSCQYSPQIPALLNQLQCTIAISTYQAGKLIFISAKNDQQVVQLPRSFVKPMGIAIHGNKMGIATADEVVVLTNTPSLGKTYPKKPNVYDGFYVPRAAYYTGKVDIHDLDWGTEGLWAVNTSFSSLVLVNEDFSFVPKWQPPFIDKLASEDRCHLNGMAMQDGKPTFVTSLGNGNTKQSWRQNITKGGLLMHVPSNEIIATELPMPHSPRLYKNQLYVLFSATGELARFDPQTGKKEILLNLNTFLRGLSIYQDYAFIGTSRLREKSSSFQQLPIADKSHEAGLIVVHLPSLKVVGFLRYKSSVNEIYDIQVLPQLRRPGILNNLTEDHKLSLSIPNTSFWAKSVENQSAT